MLIRKKEFWSLSETAYHDDFLNRKPGLKSPRDYHFIKYSMYPSLYKSRSFVPSSFYQVDIISQKHSSIEQAIFYARPTGIALREGNWFINIHSFLFLKKRLFLSELYDMGLLGKEIRLDEFGVYYTWP